MKLHNFLIICLTLIMLSCSKIDLSEFNHTAYLGTIVGNDQTGYFGETLDKEIFVTFETKGENKIEDYYVRVEKTKGNGSYLTIPYAIYQRPSDPNWTYQYPSDAISDISQPDKDGKIRIIWTLGSDFVYQSLTLYLYPDSCEESGIISRTSNPIDTVVLKATAIKPFGWAKSSGFEVRDYSLFRSFHDEVYVSNKKKIFKSSDKGINWYELHGLYDTLKNNDIFDFQFNSIGEIFVVTDSSGVYYSGINSNWNKLSAGFPEYTKPTSFLLGDSCLFIHYYNDFLYKYTFSNNELIKLKINDFWDEIHFLKRHPNGDIYAVNKSSGVWVSKDNGSIWEKIDIEMKYIDYVIEDFVIDNSGLLYIGSGDATISILNPSNYTGTVQSFESYNGSYQWIDKIQVVNNRVYFYVNYTPNKGLYTNLNWQRKDIGFDKEIFNYFVLDDESILIDNRTLYYYSD